MDIRNVYVIVGKGYTVEKVKEDLRLERYNHNFAFGEMLTDDQKTIGIVQADEVWTFGNVVANKEYNLALINQKDIWVMG